LPRRKWQTNSKKAETEAKAAVAKAAETEKTVKTETSKDVAAVEATAKKEIAAAEKKAKTGEGEESLVQEFFDLF